MQIVAVRTPHLHIGQFTFAQLVDLVPPLAERTVLAVASKLFSLITNCHRAAVQTASAWEQLVNEESDGLLMPTVTGSEGGFTANDNAQAQGRHFYRLSYKLGRLLVNAGIDHSNGQGGYLLLPPQLAELTQSLWQQLKERDHLTQLGVIVTDSAVLPLRRGVIGVALTWCGIQPLYDYHGRCDLDGQPLEVTTINLIDDLASAATLVMGEGDEATPLALITEVGMHLTFVNHPPSCQELAAVQMPANGDVYSQFLTLHKKKR